MEQLPLAMQPRAAAVFDSFVAGPNVEVVAAMRSPSSLPLWLWGAQGSGKTHLLRAACAASDGVGLGPIAAYLSLARAGGLEPESLLAFETRRVLCLDDVHAITGDLLWERALFRLFNAAAEHGIRLIFAAQAAPRQLDWSLHDWRSRAAGCVVYQLHGLDDADRIEALSRRAAQRGLQLPMETSEYLLRRMPRDLRSLFDVLDRLDEASLAAQRRLTVPFIREALEKLSGTKS